MLKKACFPTVSSAETTYFAVIVNANYSSSYPDLNEFRYEPLPPVLGKAFILLTSDLLRAVADELPKTFKGFYNS